MMLVQFISKDDERCYSYFWWYVCVSKSIFTWTEFGKVHLAHRCKLSAVLVSLYLLCICLYNYNKKHHLIKSRLDTYSLPGTLGAPQVYKMFTNTLWITAV